MKQIESYEKVLNNMSPKQWPVFLIDNAFVAGNEINIELAETFARVGTLMDFKHFVRIDQVETVETAGTFLTYCGVLGYGIYLSKYYDYGLLNQLRERANDNRLPIQQAVGKALQYIGRKKIQRLVDYTDEWKNGTPLEQRACLAAFCSPEVLKDQEGVLEALELLEWVTATFVEDIHWNQDYEMLEEELARCWSIVVAENPNKGKQVMERWMKEQYPAANSILKKSLQHVSLQTMEQEWATTWLLRLGIQ